MKIVNTAKMNVIENEHAIALYKDLLQNPEERYQNEEAFDFHLKMLVRYMNKHSKLETKYENLKRIENLIIRIKNLFKR